MARYTRPITTRIAQRPSQPPSSVQGVATSFDPAATSLFSRFTTPPTPARRLAINNLVVALKAAGVWQKCDAFYVLAAADSQAAARNWIADQYNITLGGTPTFAADRGYTGDGAAAYLDTNFNPATAVSPKYTQNSAHLSARCRTSRAGADFSLMGSRNSTTNYINIITRASSGNFVGRVNSGPNALSVANADSAGHYVANRSASNVSQGYKDGAQIITNSAVSVSIPDTNILLLARGVQGSTPDTFCSDETASASIGQSLTGPEVAALHAAELAYMQAVGAA